MFKYLNKSDFQLFAVEPVISSRKSCHFFFFFIINVVVNARKLATSRAAAAALISIWISYQNSHTRLLFLRLLVSDDALF